MARTLAGFTVTRDGEDYRLRIEDEDGEIVEMIATYEQLDMIAEALDTQLDEDEGDALAVEDDSED